jgi:hypothetical protein
MRRCSLADLETEAGKVKALVDPAGEWKPLWIDFDNGESARRLNSLARQPGLLGQALGARRSAKASLRILDACLGLGQDAAAFLTWGHSVEAWEVTPEVFQVVVDGFARARRWPRDGESGLNRRLKLKAGDSTQRLSEADVDVIYIDPIFPPETRGSALPSKGLQWLRALEDSGADGGREQLIMSALRNPHAQRIVVKGTVREEAQLHEIQRSVDRSAQWQYQRLAGDRVSFDCFRRGGLSRDGRLSRMTSE